MKKTGTYIFFSLLLLIPFLFYPVVHYSTWRSSSDVHAMLEFSAAFLAMTAGIMILIHFLATGNSFFLIISCGFTLIGAEELIHGLYALERIWHVIPASYSLAMSVTWLAGSLVLIISFLTALFFGDMIIDIKNRRLYSVIYNVVSFLGALIVGYLVFKARFLPHFLKIGSEASMFTELFVAFLYLSVFIINLFSFKEKIFTSPIMKSLMAFLILRGMVHIYSSGSNANFDSTFDIAHVLSMISYFFPIFGVWAEVLKLHRYTQVKLVELGEETEVHRKALAALKESEEKLNHIFSNISYVIYSVDVASREFNYLSPSFTRITGYTSDDIKNMGGREKFIQKVVSTDKFEEWDNFLSELNESHSQRDFSHDTFWLCKDGTFKCLNDHLIPIIIEGKVDSTYGILSDITERLAVEEVRKEKVAELTHLNEELETYIYANQELKQFTYLASHQLQEPIRTIANFSKIIEEDYSETLGNPGVKHLHIIRDASKRMARLIDTLLDYSQLGRNKILGYTDCSTLVESVIADLDSQIAESGAVIEVTYLPYLYVYEVEFQQLLQNLISNAIKFRNPDAKPKVQISSLKQNDRWLFAVADNGIGIDKVHYEQIFDLFKRLHRNEDEFEGYGIGLAYCKKIVQIHQGEIWVESETGRGSTFYFTIPMLKETDKFF